MKKFKKPSIEYSDFMGDSICHYLSHKNLKKGLYYNNLFFIPENYIYTMKSHYPDFHTETIGKSFERYKKYYKKLWRGEDLTNKTIFIFSYLCGHGDYILFCRYIPILEKMAGKVIIEVEDNLISLYRYNFPNCKVIMSNDCEHDIEYDYTYHHEYFLNFQKDLDHFPYPEGYLKADPKLIKKHSALFNTNKFKVGIYHEGKSDTDERAIRITKMFPIFDNRQCQFYALNADKAGPYAKQVHEECNIIELQPHINNAHDTAAMMKNMDLIISTDSFVPNLSGALGIKTYMLLHEKPGWRWFDEFYKTDWYDSVKILRRSPYMNVEAQIDEMARLLNKECEEFYAKNH